MFIKCLICVSCVLLTKDSFIDRCFRFINSESTDNTLTHSQTQLSHSLSVIRCTRPHFSALKQATKATRISLNMTLTIPLQGPWLVVKSWTKQAEEPVVPHSERWAPSNSFSVTLHGTYYCKKVTGIFWGIPNKGGLQL